jgi:hypothetical protein
MLRTADQLRSAASVEDYGKRNSWLEVIEDPHENFRIIEKDEY